MQFKPLQIAQNRSIPADADSSWDDGVVGYESAFPYLTTGAEDATATVLAHEGASVRSVYED